MRIDFSSALDYARLDSRDIYRHLRKLLVFKSVRKRFHVVSKPDHPPLKNTEFSCFLTDTYSRNQMSQIHKLNGVGARNRQIKTMLLRFLSCRKGPQKLSNLVLCSSLELGLGVACGGLGVAGGTYCNTECLNGRILLAFLLNFPTGLGCLGTCGHQ